MGGSCLFLDTSGEGLHVRPLSPRLGPWWQQLRSGLKTTMIEGVRAEHRELPPVNLLSGNKGSPLVQSLDFCIFARHFLSGCL